MEYHIDHHNDKGHHRFENIEIKGYFSVDKNLNIKFDCSQLRYYIPQEKQLIHYDLNKGIKQIRYHNSIDNGKFNNIIRWIQKNYAEIQTNSRCERWLQPKFILEYAILIRLLRTPFGREDSWVFCAVKWRGNIYLRVFDTNRLIEVKKNPYQSGKILWAKKFRHRIMSDTANGAPLSDEELNKNSQFFCVYQSCLGDHTLLYSCEMHAVCSDEILRDPLPRDKLKFISLQTNAVLSNERQLSIFEKHRPLTWWTLNVATGIEHLVCCFRNDAGIVKELKTYRINDLPKFTKNYWSPSGSIEFCNDFLNYVTNTVKDNYNQTIYKFEKIPFGDIEVTELLPFSEYSFLPEWYIHGEAQYFVDKNC